MDGETITNASIESAALGWKASDGRVFDFTIFFNAPDRSLIRFGGYALDQYEKQHFKRRIGTAWGLDVLMQIMQTVGVNVWERLPGTLCRIRCDRFGRVLMVGHILEDRWFDIARHIQEFKEFAAPLAAVADEGA